MIKTQIIGIDVSNGIDYSAINSYCTGCKTVIESKCFLPSDDEIKATIFKKCPNCGVKFDRHVTAQ